MQRLLYLHCLIVKWSPLVSWCGGGYKYQFSLPLPSLHSYLYPPVCPISLPILGWVVVSPLCNLQLTVFCAPFCRVSLSSFRSSPSFFSSPHPIVTLQWWKSASRHCGIFVSRSQWGIISELVIAHRWRAAFTDSLTAFMKGTRLRRCRVAWHFICLPSLSCLPCDASYAYISSPCLKWTRHSNDVYVSYIYVMCHSDFHWPFHINFL